MTSLAFKLSAVFLLFLGEALCIYAEVAAARSGVAGLGFRGYCSDWAIFAASGALLLAGYALGTRAFDDIWVVTVISVVSILLLEPVIVYAVFRELPRLGPAIGLALGAMGLVAAMF